MTIPFWKMHGAGNDFILVDDRVLTFPVYDVRWIDGVASRRTGIGCDGIILIRPSENADFRMRFINPDGSEAGMCGNGLRCVCRLACELGIVPSRMRVETQAGLMEAESEGDSVCVRFPAKEYTTHRGELQIDEWRVPYTLIDTGVPHVVVFEDDLAGVDDPVRQLGAPIRRHACFEPAGTNADFVSPGDGNTLCVRTYERGVEAETLACGTGVVASALVAVQRGRAVSPVTILTAGGDTMTVTVSGEGGDVSLTGPTRHVYKGEIEYAS